MLFLWLDSSGSSWLSTQAQGFVKWHGSEAQVVHATYSYSRYILVPRAVEKQNIFVSYCSKSRGYPLSMQ